MCGSLDTEQNILTHVHIYAHIHTHQYTSIQVSVLYIRYIGNWTSDCRKHPEQCILAKTFQTNLSRMSVFVFVTCKVLSTH